MKRTPLCNLCRFRQPGIPMRCDAFPEGVPARFRFGADGHVDPVQGDKGIQFELAADLAEPSRRLALRMVEAYRKLHHQQVSTDDADDAGADRQPRIDVLAGLQKGEL